MSGKKHTFGTFLGNMVMPNIGALVAFGLITALFIPTGWLPNAKLAQLVNPMMNFLLPILIAYTGGKLIDGERGGVVGAVAAIGVIVGSDIPMFLGAMLMGPFGGLCIKLFDQAVAGKIHPNFEVLVSHFSAGILGGALAVFSFLVIGPCVSWINALLSVGVNFVIAHQALPASALLLEPAKVLFLNNAISYGILTPLGVTQAAETGKSILFLLISNPGPGLGLLAAYWLRGNKKERQSVPGAMIIHFLGGIHEIYFPYVLMNPLTMVGVIAGGAAGTLCFTLLGAGLIAPPSPGSIFSILAMSPKTGMLSVLAGIAVSAVVSCLVCSLFIRKKEPIDAELPQS